MKPSQPKPIIFENVLRKIYSTTGAARTAAKDSAIQEVLRDTLMTKLSRADEICAMLKAPNKTNKLHREIKKYSNRNLCAVGFL